MALQSTVRGFPYYEGGDPPQGNAQQQALAAYLNANGAKAQRGTLAARPAASAALAECLYYATDAGRAYWCDGTNWKPLGQFPDVVTTLPGSPGDGDRVVLQTAAMATAKVRWQLAYKTGSGWEFEGGQPLYAKDGVGSFTPTMNNSVNAFSGDTMSLAIPAPGRYRVDFGAVVGVTVPADASSGDASSLSIGPSATGMSFGDPLNVGVLRNTSGSDRVAYSSPVGVVESASISGTLILKYLGQTPMNGTAMVFNRWMKLTPVVL